MIKKGKMLNISCICCWKFQVFFYVKLLLLETLLSISTCALSVTLAMNCTVILYCWLFKKCDLQTLNFLSCTISKLWLYLKMRSLMHTNAHTHAHTHISTIPTCAYSYSIVYRDWNFLNVTTKLVCFVTSRQDLLGIAKPKNVSRSTINPCTQLIQFFLFNRIICWLMDRPTDQLADRPIDWPTD